MLFDGLPQRQVACTRRSDARQFGADRSENVSENRFHVVSVVKLPRGLREFQFFRLRPGRFDPAAFFRLRRPAVFALPKLQRGLRHVLRLVLAAARPLQKPFADQRQHMRFALADQPGCVGEADQQAVQCRFWLRPRGRRLRFRFRSLRQTKPRFRKSQISSKIGPTYRRIKTSPSYGPLRFDLKAPHSRDVARLCVGFGETAQHSALISARLWPSVSQERGRVRARCGRAVHVRPLS